MAIYLSFLPIWGLRTDSLCFLCHSWLVMVWLTRTRIRMKIMTQDVWHFIQPSYSSSPRSVKVKGLYDAQAPMCPVCQAILRPGELQEHMEQELAKLAQIQIRYHTHSVDKFHCQHSFSARLHCTIMIFIHSHLFSSSNFSLVPFICLSFPSCLCPRLSILFSFQRIINLDSLLCHLRAVFTSCLIVPYIFHITACGLMVTSHTAGG